MVLNEGVLMFACKSLVSEILNDLIFNNGLHFLAHCASKRDRTIIVWIARVSSFENGGNERF